MRRPHYLTHNKASDSPQQCIWFDTETYMIGEDGNRYTVEQARARDAANISNPNYHAEYRHFLNFGYACYMRKHHNAKWTDEEWLRFTTPDEFWQFVSRKTRQKAKLYLFCHNTSFDLPVLNVFAGMACIGFSLRSAIIDAPPTILRFCSGTKSIVILDTLNFWRMPLKFLGEKIGLAKLDMPDNNDMGVDWDTYGKRDVEIIRAACLDWFDYLQRMDYGSFAYTLASQSMRAFRHRYMRHQIFIDDNERSLRLTRSAFYGGRVECFYIGRYTGNFYALDVNGMYPYVMSCNKFPYKLVASTKYSTVDDVRIWLRSYAVCANVRVRTSIPFIPVRMNNKLMFPTGTFDCFISTPEIEYALQHAEILSIHEVAVYENEMLFEELMRDWINIKEQAKEAGDFVKEFHTKKISNSFFGKWGQTGGKWTEEFNTDDLSCKKWVELDAETGKLIHHRQLGGLVQHKEPMGESRESFPAIAGHVTAYARMELWGIIEQAGMNNVYYCDTDCVVVNDEGRERLANRMHDVRAGALKIAGEYETIEVRGNKDYRFDSKAKTKGVRKDAVWLTPNKVRQTQWSSLKGLVGRGDTTAPTVKVIEKNLKRVYDKGVVLESGKVEPHLL